MNYKKLILHKILFTSTSVRTDLHFVLEHGERVDLGRTSFGGGRRGGGGRLRVEIFHHSVITIAFKREQRENFNLEIIHKKNTVQNFCDFQIELNCLVGTRTANIHDRRRRRCAP